MQTHATPDKEEQNGNNLISQMSSSDTTQCKSIMPPAMQFQKENGANVSQLFSTTDGRDQNKFQFPTQLKSTSSPSENSTIQTKSSGNGLPGEVQAKMENSMGHDFSNVQMHTNSKSATDVGALAYAQGNDVHFAPGQFKPDTTSGQELIGHELAHVVQQREGRVQPTKMLGKGMAVNDDPKLEKEADEMGKKAAQNTTDHSSITKSSRESSATTQMKVAQMLLKGEYPWTGVVFNAKLLAMRDAPNGNTLADLPDDTLVNVKDAKGNWLELQVDTSQPGIVLNAISRKKLVGTTLDGFSDHKYVDDAASHEMQEMVGEESTWVSSGPGLGNTFETWASAKVEPKTAPNLDASTTINCWEMVLLSAYRIGAIDWAWIHNLYVNIPIANWQSHMAGSMRKYDPKKPPSRGELVFFDGINHVALATGKGEEVYTFWPPPDSPSVSGTLDKVKIRTISSLQAYMTKTWGLSPIEIGSPNW